MDQLTKASTVAYRAALQTFVKVARPIWLDAVQRRRINRLSFCSVKIRFGKMKSPETQLSGSARKEMNLIMSLQLDELMKFSK